MSASPRQCFDFPEGSKCKNFTEIILKVYTELMNVVAIGTFADLKVK